MGHHNNPYDWDYSDHPEKHIVRKRCERLGAALLGNPAQFADHHYSDTRIAHKYIFRQFTPKGYSHYAGKYRGENYEILREARVGVGGDDRVGELPKLVKAKMELFDKQFLKTIDVYEAQFKANKIDRGILLVKLAEHIGTLLVRFLTIHPYLNGNGHIGRVLVLTILGRLNIWPAKWTIDDRPPYADAIYEHRRGNVRPLTEVLLKCIQG